MSRLWNPVILYRQVFTYTLCVLREICLAATTVLHAYADLSPQPSDESAIIRQVHIAQNVMRFPLIRINSCQFMSVARQKILT